MYRLLLAGTILARAYMEPLFRAREEGGEGPFFVRCGTDYWAEDAQDVEGTRHMSQDFAYIRQPPVFNWDLSDWSEAGQWGNQKYKTCLGPFVSWVIDDGRKRQQKNSQQSAGIEPDWVEKTADVGALRELMLLLTAYDQFNNNWNTSTHRGSKGIHYI
jgi:hypothetical protein